MKKKKPAFSAGKTPSGVKGLDLLTHGGLAAGRTTLVIGPRGSGKTLLALQSLYSGARQGEPGIFVSFRETRQAVELKSALFGWKLRGMERRGLLHFMDPPEIRAGRVDLAGVLSEVGNLAQANGARRIVFDALEVPLALMHENLCLLQEMFRLRDWLFQACMTGIVTADPGRAAGAGIDRAALIRFLADLTIALDERVAPGGNPSGPDRFARLLRYRSNVNETEFPLVIGGNGIEILAPGGSHECPGPNRKRHTEEIEQARKALTQRIKALDRFLEIKQAELDFLLDEEGKAASDTPAPAELVAEPTAERVEG